MAESVDALVSNTSGAIRAGSIPAPGTNIANYSLEKSCKTIVIQDFFVSTLLSVGTKDYSDYQLHYKVIVAVTMLNYW